MAQNVSLLTLVVCCVCACSSDPGLVDAGVIDAGELDAGVDGGTDAGHEPAADPTGFYPVGQLKVARAQASATRLDDGRVLVVGGEDSAYALLDSVELFDPMANIFTAVASLPQPRSYHSATLLRNGKVLVAGGGQGSEISLPSGTGALASALLYDPVTNTWSATGNMTVARAGHRAALLDDGRVLVVGGGNAVGYPCANSHPNCTVADSLASAEIYDPLTETWTATGSLAKARIGFALNSVAAGIIATGGAANNQGLDSTEIFDSVSAQWRAGPKLAAKLLYHAAAVMDGQLVIAGGKLANVMPVTTVERLNASATAWSAGSSLQVARTGALFVTLQSGHGLIVGGNNQIGQPAYLDLAALYDVAANTWTTIGPLSQGRYGHAVVALDDGSVLVVGGRTASGAVKGVDRSR